MFKHLLSISLLLLMTCFIIAQQSNIKEPHSNCENNCPAICKCSCWINANVFVDCSYLNLTSLPSLERYSSTSYGKFTFQGNLITEINQSSIANLKWFQSLDLSDNPIKNIPSYLFRSTYLRELRISADSFEYDAFEGLPNLNSLTIVGNLKLSSLSSSLLKRIPNLNHIVIKNTGITEIPSLLFAGLAYLQTIVVVNNRMLTKIANDAINGNPRLKSVDLSYNSFETLPQNIQWRDHQINILHLNSNQIKNIPEDAFSTLPLLTILDLSKNNLETLPVKVFQSLVKVEFIYLQNNTLEVLDAGLFVSNTKIVSLDFSYNMLETLPGEIFKSLILLRSVNLGHNQIKTLNVSQYFNKVLFQVELKILDLSYNHLESFDGEGLKFTFRSDQSKLILNNNYNLSIVDLSKVQFIGSLDLSYNCRLNQSDSVKYPEYYRNPDRTYSCLKKLPQLVYDQTQWDRGLLDFSWNEIESFELASNNLMINGNVLKLSHNRITHGNYQTAVQRRPWILNGLDLSFNNISDVKAINISDLASLSDLNLGHNNIKSIDGFKVTPNNLKDLDLSYNQIDVIPIDEINLHRNLGTLSLDSNSVSYIDDFVFGNSTKLIKLNLANNRIQNISKETFSSLKNLQMLYLQNNKLKVLSNQFDSLTNLISLYLTNNSIETVITTLSTLTNLVTISLSDNNIHNLPNGFLNRVEYHPTLNAVSLQNNELLCTCQLISTCYRMADAYKNCFPLLGKAPCPRAKADGTCKHIEYNVSLSLSMFQGNINDIRKRNCQPGQVVIQLKEDIQRDDEDLPQSIKDIEEPQSISALLNFIYPCCNLCPLSNTVCTYRDECKADQKEGFQCECEQGYIGRTCDIDFANCYKTQTCGLCNSITCKNGGKCIETNPKTYRCECPKETSGLHCQRNYTDCKKRTCEYSGLCEEISTDTFECKFKKPYWGDFCNARQADQPCKKGENCTRHKKTPGRGSYSCNCNSTDCKSLNRCVKDNPCLNGGMCIAKDDGQYHCDCLPNSHGNHCETKDGVLTQLNDALTHRASYLFVSVFVAIVFFAFQVSV